MAGSQMRYAAASSLIAVGLLVGASAGVALADHGGTHHGGDDDHRGPGGGFGSGFGGGFGGSGAPGTGGSGGSGGFGGFGHGGQDSSGQTGGAGNRPQSVFGSGREPGSGRGPGGPATHTNESTPGTQSMPGTSGGEPILREEPEVKEPTGQLFPPGEEEPNEPCEKDPCEPGFPFPPFPFLHDGDDDHNWTGIADYFQSGFTDYVQRTTDYMNSWADTFQQVIVPPRPEPEPGPSFRITEEEPVLDAGGAGGGDVEAAGVSEPPVLEAPVVVPLAVPPLPVPAPVLPAPPAAVARGPWIPPRSLANPPPGVPAPRIGNAVPPAREPVPVAGTPMGSQASFRTGYNDFLRTAGMAQLAAAALPGVGGILLLTAGGGLIGYRQAKAGHSVRTPSVGRFLR